MVHYVIYPHFEEFNETRFPPYIELLRQALDRTTAKYGPYKLKPSKLPMNASRSIRELQSGTIDVLWTSTTEERERVLLPVRIPIEKGLLSYRVALISLDRQPAIDRVQTLADLRKLTIGQGIGWGDIDVYRYNGIKVTEANYSSLFVMVSSGRFDLFPRGVGEVFDEYDTYSGSNPELAIEKNLALYYPWPYYFFFNRKTGQHLAKRVEDGLRMMIRDGSFDAWFQKHYAAAIRRANLVRRRIIRLENPLLPKDTPLDDASLWFSPATTHAK
ncbi:MAG: transporter substrate-binding domain-containing protein [Pseudogulbenkiania sp.]|nr:transporter substrate-binding domain-containing protein [Pseudogulbenkiania sp.]